MRWSVRLLASIAIAMI
jgi:hypothetical protein